MEGQVVYIPQSSAPVFPPGKLEKCGGDGSPALFSGMLICRGTNSVPANAHGFSQTPLCQLRTQEGEEFKVWYAVCGRGCKRCSIP